MCLFKLHLRKTDFYENKYNNWYILTPLKTFFKVKKIVHYFNKIKPLTEFV